MNNRWLSSHQLAQQGPAVLRLKGIAQSEHFVKDAAQTPHVRLLVVPAIFPNLRRHDEGRAYFGLGEVEGLAHELGDAEVADLHLVAGSDEDVVGLEVAVQDLLLVDVLEAQRQLDEPLEHLRLPQRTPLRAPPLQVLLQVAPLSVLHNDADRLALHKRLQVSHHVAVVHLLHQLYLLQDLLLCLPAAIFQTDALSSRRGTFMM